MTGSPARRRNFAAHAWKMEIATLNRTKNLLFGVTPAALLLPLIASVSATADPLNAAEFAVATCRNAMEDLAKVDAMAKERQHPTAPPRPTDSS
jgi:hypothetical protein